jgi:hypothetical protein
MYKEIKNIEKDLTIQQVENVLAYWKQKNDTDSIETYESLVRLGDSKELACATALVEKSNKKGTDVYYNAYCI